MQPLSPLDGRYASTVEALRPFFTESALIRARLFVELRYLIALGEEKGVRELTPFTEKEEKAMLRLVDDFSEKEAEKVRQIEKTTNHDVKAVEYYLKQELPKILGKKCRIEFIHFALTSEDTNNLAYGVLINEALTQVLHQGLLHFIEALERFADANEKKRMLSLTHGQPAVPTTLGKELMVFVDRLDRQAEQLFCFSMQGKFGGAVGNYAAHRAAYPKVDWEEFGTNFVSSLGLEPLQYTTQINPHDDLAELSHAYVRINTILLGLSRDLWTYVSRGIFKQRVIAGEVGSSTMPHKVNPIDFENSEGNLGLSSALFTHFAEKLPISRLQRDLSDSTVQRNIGVAFGYHTLALASLKKGLSKLSVDEARLQQELADHPEVFTEAIQTVMRKNGISDAYEQMKALSRGKKITLKDLLAFIEKLKMPKEDKRRLRELLQ